MKNNFLSIIVCCLCCTNLFSQNNVTFQLDMNTVDPATFTTPEVNGTFNSWCGNCAAMSDADGDNIWEITIDIANGAYEFKFSADNWGIQESLLPGSPCTVTNFGFTNRVLNVSGDTTLSAVCWESCDDCASGPTAYDVTFEVDMRGVAQSFTTPEVNGDFNGWCGNCWPMTDADGDSIWQFQMLFAPGDSLEWKYSADNWTFQEELDSNLSCITINYDPTAPNGYGFVNRVALVNSDTTFSSPWNLCLNSLSTPGCMDSLASNYSPLATTDDGSCLYSVTFNVDMNCELAGSFGFVHLESPLFGWCGGCVPMSDPDGDGVHSVTVDLALGNFEYKYAIDNFSGQEDLVDDMLSGGTCAPVTDYSTYANRQVTVAAGLTTADTYGSCDPCSPSLPTTSLISACGDFVSGPTNWPYVLVATTPDSAASSQGTQTFSMNVTSLPSGGATFRVAKTTANGNWFFGPPQTMVVGSNGITVSAVTFNRAVKFQFSSGDVEFNALSLNGENSDCVAPLPPPTTSLISDCNDFVSGPTAWPYVLVATTPDSGLASQGAQTFTMNVTDTANGAGFRVAKTVANGNWFFGPPQAITLGSNSITVSAVTFNRAVKFQFSSGDIEFDALSLNGEASSCVAVLGCTDSMALNYDLTATLDDSSCIYCVYGCMDSLACNYNSTATCDDGSCLTAYGCADTLACNYDPTATCDDGSCLTLYGCTDTLACNYDSSATCDDGSCLTNYGCMNPAALNYDSLATCPDSCIFPQVTYGCTDSTALNYNPLATIDDSSCIYCFYGCMDSLACNYDPIATCDDGSCLTVYGCTDTLACNYDPIATCDDGSCLTVYGCTDTLACNYDPTANCDDGSCLTLYGCTDSLATNYDPLAACDDGSCVYGYSVTFQLDLRGVTSITYTTPEVNGMFNGWCGNCNPLEDLDGDSIWETTLVLDTGTYEYKYSVDNFTVEENLFGGDSCTVSNFGFTNRILHVDRDTILAPVCWELCGDCDSGPSSYSVTFRLDMSEYVGPPYTTPEVNGTFNNWCGSCWAMEDPDGDNVWEITGLLGVGDTVLYKFSADGWNIQEELDSSLSSSCVLIGYDPGAPNGWGYVNRFHYVTSETILDAVCWNDCVECQGQSFIGEGSISSIQLFPNPSTGLVKIKSEGVIKRCDVYSVIGELVSTEEVGSGKNEHSLSIAKNGLYYISVYTEKGVVSQKLTIQK